MLKALSETLREWPREWFVAPGYISIREAAAVETTMTFGIPHNPREAVSKLKPRTVVNYRICLHTHAAPVIGSIKLDMVTLSDIAKLHQRIGQTKPMTANRIIECIGSVYRYAATCGLVKRGHNPAAHVEAFREQRRERFLTSEELARLGDAIREAETTGIPWEVDGKKPTAKHAAAALRLLIFTGARLREILWLKWNYVDFASTGCCCCRTARLVARPLCSMPRPWTGEHDPTLRAPGCGPAAASFGADCWSDRSGDGRDGGHARPEALAEIHDALARGQIAAWSATIQEPVPRELPAATWSIFEFAYAEQNGLLYTLTFRPSGSIDEQPLKDLRFKSVEVRRHWPGAEPASRPLTTVAKQTECKRWLSSEMRASPDRPRPKSQVLAEAKKRFPNLSKRGFNRAWGDAINETGAEKWSKAGRRSA